MKLQNSQAYFITIAERLLKSDFIRFCIVGTSGFLVNLAFLSLFYGILELPILLAQLLSAEGALLSNLIWHHNWTYAHHGVKKTKRKIAAQFHLSSWVAIVGGSLVVSALVTYFAMAYGLALAIASLLSLTWNFAWSKLVIWRRSHGDDELAVNYS